MKSTRGNRTLVLYRHSPRGSVGSLSLQRLEKRIGAGNIKTGRAKIALPPEREVSRMDRLFYPAVFHRAEEGGFWVTFPDIPECMWSYVKI